MRLRTAWTAAWSHRRLPHISFGLWYAVGFGRFRTGRSRLVCGSCGAANREGAKFCNECGGALVFGARTAARRIGLASGSATNVGRRWSVGRLRGVRRSAGWWTCRRWRSCRSCGSCRCCSSIWWGSRLLSEGREAEDVRELLGRYFLSARTWWSGMAG